MPNTLLFLQVVNLFRLPPPVVVSKMPADAMLYLQFMAIQKPSPTYVYSFAMQEMNNYRFIILITRSYVPSFQSVNWSSEFR